MRAKVFLIIIICITFSFPFFAEVRELSIQQLEERKKELQNQIDIDKKIISSLNNPDSLERYAREKLFMKKQNEDIYIIEFKD